MKKIILEEMGGTYIRHGDYFIPGLIMVQQYRLKYNYDILIIDRKDECLYNLHIPVGVIGGA